MGAKVRGKLNATDGCCSIPICFKIYNIVVIIIMKAIRKEKKEELKVVRKEKDT